MNVKPDRVSEIRDTLMANPVDNSSEIDEPAPCSFSYMKLSPAQSRADYASRLHTDTILDIHGTNDANGTKVAWVHHRKASSRYYLARCSVGILSARRRRLSASGIVLNGPDHADTCSRLACSRCSLRGTELVGCFCNQGLLDFCAAVIIFCNGSF